MLTRHNLNHDSALQGDSLDEKRLGNSTRLRAMLESLGCTTGLPERIVRDMTANFDGMVPIQRFMREGSTTDDSGEHKNRGR
jgi:hypothetical protein